MHDAQREDGTPTMARASRHLARYTRTIRILGIAGVVAYVLALAAFVLTLVTDDRRPAISAAAFAVVGLSVDMRRLSAHVIARTVHTVALWNDDVPADDDNGE